MKQVDFFIYLLILHLGVLQQMQKLVLQLHPANANLMKNKNETGPSDLRFRVQAFF